MNPETMNKGYRRLFWSAFFTLLWTGPFDSVFPWFPGIIGLYLCYSGTRFLLRESGSMRLKQARAFSFTGAVIWTFQCVLVIPILEEYIPWSLRFLSYFLGFVILLQVYVNVLMAAGELLGDTWETYFSRQATIFTLAFTLCTVGSMAGQFADGLFLSIGNVQFHPFSLLQLFLGIWIMCLMARLRRNYPLLTT